MALPVLVEASAVQSVPPALVTSIEQALMWRYEARLIWHAPASASLELRLLLNEGNGLPEDSRIVRAERAGDDLFLARSEELFVFDYQRARLEIAQQAVTPLLVAASDMVFAPRNTLADTIDRLLLSLRTPPIGIMRSAAPQNLSIAISYAYRPAATPDNLEVSLPIALLQQAVDPADVPAISARLAAAIRDWYQLARPATASARLRFAVTAYGAGEPPAPLLHLAGVSVTPAADPGWWR